MKNLINRVKHVLVGEEGTVHVEIVQWFTVMMVVTSAIVFAVIKVATWLNNH